MGLDRSFVELNRASTARIRALATQLTDEQLQRPVGEHWTVAIALVHLAFWDERVAYVLVSSEREGKLVVPGLGIEVNDVSLRFWAAIPPRTAAHLAVETAEALDRQLENYSPALLEEIYNHNKRWVIRALHRNEHLDEVDAALAKQ